MGNRAERHDSPRSCRDAFSKKCYRIHKTGQNTKRRHKTRTRDLCNTRRETQIQTKLDQPPRKNGQHQKPEIRPHLQTPGKKGSRTPQETMATRRCRNRSNDLIHGGRWWWIWFMLILKWLKDKIGLLYKWGHEMPTILAAFLNNCHISSTHFLQQSPDISPVAITLEATLPSKTSEQSFCHTLYRTKNTVIMGIFNNINSQLDAAIIILLIMSIGSTCFGQ